MASITAATFDRFALDPADDDPGLVAELGWKVRVPITGQGLGPRAKSLVGQVGDVAIDHLVQVSDTQALGFMQEVPPVGATLRLAWAGDELVDTGITFPGFPNV